MKRAGQCLCGAVKFTAELDSSEVGACHCKMCQRWSGSAFVGFNTQPDAVVFEGDEHIGTYKSSDWAERSFCRECGTSLFYRLTAPGDHHGIRYIAVGLLDDTTGLKLTREMFYDKKGHAFEYAGDTKKQTEAEIFAMFGGG